MEVGDKEQRAGICESSLTFDKGRKRFGKPIKDSIEEKSDVG